ncbi:MAG TPA: hypothetical protein ENH35_00160 [Candidatus Moranbacteria bacterium]|nr:hypothetical protein [Candidatus Moranbacteria bacterium]
MTKRTKRKWHPNFIKYMKFIVSHPNYKGMPFLYKNDEEIRWVVTRSSDAGLARLKWWDKKRKELGLPKGDAWISKTARKNHPTSEKPCQICGKVLKLDYIYPNKRGSKSPGAMSNAPDRLDGFHSYNMCCRSKHDTGRHKENLNRYGEDRRAYENWSDGDWKAASWLMKEFNKHGVSPDHVGPLSLGFSHRPKFQPMTSAQNSAKNNRMSYADVKLLINDEKLGEKVVSAHSKFLWDKLKKHVKNDKDALKLCKFMRLNLHNVLITFHKIHKQGHDKFLITNFLHPEYARFSIKFIGFNPKNGFYQKMVKKSGTKKQYVNNAKRYIRKSLEALDKYENVSNRNSINLSTQKIDIILADLLKFLNKKHNKKALHKLGEIFIELADIGYKKFMKK